MSRPSLVSFWFSRRGESFYREVWTSLGYSDDREDWQNRHGLIGRMMAEAPLYVVEKEMCQLAWGAGAKRSDEPLLLEDLPSPSGLALLGQPMTHADPKDPGCGLLWATVRSGEQDQLWIFAFEDRYHVLKKDDPIDWLCPGCNYQVDPQASDYRSPVPATSGRTADGTGWVLHLAINYPVWDRTAYGMTVNIWLACVIVA